jgi:hypothetical protein
VQQRAAHVCVVFGAARTTLAQRVQAAALLHQRLCRLKLLGSQLKFAPTELAPLRAVLVTPLQAQRAVDSIMTAAAQGGELRTLCCFTLAAHVCTIDAHLKDDALAHSKAPPRRRRHQDACYCASRCVLMAECGGAGCTCVSRAGHRADVPLGGVSAAALDLASFDSVRAFAKSFSGDNSISKSFFCDDETYDLVPWGASLARSAAGKLSAAASV